MNLFNYMEGWPGFDLHLQHLHELAWLSLIWPGVKFDSSGDVICKSINKLLTFFNLNCNKYSLPDPEILDSFWWFWNGTFMIGRRCFENGAAQWIVGVVFDSWKKIYIVSKHVRMWLIYMVKLICLFKFNEKHKSLLFQQPW